MIKMGIMEYVQVICAGMSPEVYIMCMVSILDVKMKSSITKD